MCKIRNGIIYELRELGQDCTKEYGDQHFLMMTIVEVELPLKYVGTELLYCFAKGSDGQ